VESLRFKAGYTYYEHAELSEDGPKAIFHNRSLETRLELTGLRCTGLAQTENTHFSALSAEGGPDTVPLAHSKTSALFLVEEGEGRLRLIAGARYENVKREPVSGRQRTFDLGSASIGAAWPFMPGYNVRGRCRMRSECWRPKGCTRADRTMRQPPSISATPTLTKKPRATSSSRCKEYGRFAPKGQPVPRQHRKPYLRTYRQWPERRGRQPDDQLRFYCVVGRTVEFPPTRPAPLKLNGPFLPA
jgi:hypothetical protein